MKLGLKINKQAADHAIVKVFFDASRIMMPQLASWIQKTFLGYLINGGQGITGLRETPFFEWLFSDEGLSELGIHKKDAFDLINAYKDSFVVRSNATTVEFLFGDTAKLIAGTPHPYAGVGELTEISSWMEWVLDKKVVDDRGFVPRSKVPKRFRRNIRLRSPRGGLMLPPGVSESTGKWRVPPEFTKYDIRWLAENETRIMDVIQEKMISLLQTALRK